MRILVIINRFIGDLSENLEIWLAVESTTSKKQPMLIRPQLEYYHQKICRQTGTVSRERIGTENQPSVSIYIQALFLYISEQNKDPDLVSFFCFVFWSQEILVPQSGIQLMPPTVEVWSPNHWTTREFPSVSLWNLHFCKARQNCGAGEDEDQISQS